MEACGCKSVRMPHSQKFFVASPLGSNSYGSFRVQLQEEAEVTEVFYSKSIRMAGSYQVGRVPCHVIFVYWYLKIKKQDHCEMSNG